MTKKRRADFICFLFLMSFIGCATINVPGNTIANSTLKSDIARMINIIENAQAPNCKHEIVDTKFLKQEGNSYLEEWKVLSCGKEIIYPVKLIPSPSGGTDFSVKTPDKGVR